MNYYPQLIPNEGNPNSPIWFIGEAGGEQEMEQGRPFVGTAGDMLMGVMERNGLQRSDVYLGNLFPHRPYGNKFESILPIVNDHVKKLWALIEQYKPVVVVPLGNWPLKFLTGQTGITRWRGSIIPFLNDKTIKCIPTYHPSYVVRKRSTYPIFDIDIKRVVDDSTFRDFHYPKYEMILNPKGLELEEWTQRLEQADRLAIDIETVKSSRKIICVGFAPSPTTAVVLPYDTGTMGNLDRILSSHTSKKAFQNGLFDITQLHLNGHTVVDNYAAALKRPFTHDTHVAAHVMALELPRSLDFLTSIYTRQPYYKTVGRGTIPSDNKEWSARVEKQSLYEYNAKDCCVTFDIWMKQEQELVQNKNQLKTFQFEMEELIVAMATANAGMHVDTDRRDLLIHACIKKWNKLQYILDRLTGYETNVRSTKLKSILYDKDKVNLPSRRKHDGTITTDEDAIVSLIGFCKDKLEGLVREDAILTWTVRLKICETILVIRGLRQLLSNYLMPVMKDKTPRAVNGRIHSQYKPAQTDTGRWASSKYVDGTGNNAQTWPRDPMEVDDDLLTTTDEGIILLKQLDDEPDMDDMDNEDEE